MGTIHLISDSTGETVNAMAEACLAQFQNHAPTIRLWRLVRTPERASQVMAQVALAAAQEPGSLIVYSIVIPEVQTVIEVQAAMTNIPTHHALSPLSDFLGRHLNLEARHPTAGKQHALTEAYFKRVAAIEFALKHDDGMAPDTLHQADVVLVGVSRCAKTPTSLYLANQGVKAGNVPIVPGLPLPPVLLYNKELVVVALTQDANNLLTIRRKRLSFLGGGDQDGSSYVDPVLVREEVTAAIQLYRQQGWPIIDSAQKSVEEVAAEVQEILASHPPHASQHSSPPSGTSAGTPAGTPAGNPAGTQGGVS
ncbi:MAG: kinase/pyrophosphorylase [Alphaproteobacteria bacterium]|nr:kinase/pyrophosphorylase [Alphaproteobacteria bacterium]